MSLYTHLTLHLLWRLLVSHAYQARAEHKLWDCERRYEAGLSSVGETFDEE